MVTNKKCVQSRLDTLYPREPQTVEFCFVLLLIWFFFLFLAFGSSFLLVVSFVVNLIYFSSQENGNNYHTPASTYRTGSL